MEEVLEWLGNVSWTIILVLSVVYLSLFYYGDIEMANNFLLNTEAGKVYLYILSIFKFLTEFVLLLLCVLVLCAVLNLLCHIFNGLLNTLLRYISCFFIFPLILSYHFFTHVILFFNRMDLPGVLFGFYFYLPVAGITVVVYGFMLISIYYEYIKEY
jgi:hypothetical protein